MTTFNTLMGMPMGVVAAAFNAVSKQAPTNSKSGMARVVAQAVDQGQITLHEVRNILTAARSATVSQPVPAFNPPPPAAPSVAATIRADLTALASDVGGLGMTVGQVQTDITAVKIETSTLAAKVRGMDVTLAGVRGSVQDAVAAASGEAKSLRAQVQALADKVGQINLPADEVAATIRAAVQDAFGPLMSAAQANGTQAAILAEVQSQPAGRASCLDVFGVDLRHRDGSPLMFTTWGHPEAPAVDQCFIWTEPVLRHLWAAQEFGRNLWMGGPAGTGKTQTAEQFAARTGRMFRRFVFDRFSTRDDFLGAHGLENGSTTFQAGPVLEVYTTPGAVCLLDEIGIGQPAAIATLNAFLERQARVAYAGTVWHRAGGTMFLAADNSLGQGDTSGRFAGVQSMNTALLDRFSLVMPFAYLDPGIEAEALTRHTGCSMVLAQHVVAALAAVRTKVQSGEVIDSPSIRQMVAFIEACRVLEPAEAWQSAITARQPAESEVGLAAVFAASIDADLIIRELGV